MTGEDTQGSRFVSQSACGVAVGMKTTTLSPTLTDGGPGDQAPLV
jgi:hypothetical protein